MLLEATSKRELRNLAKAKRDEISSNQRAVWSEQAAHHFSASVQVSGLSVAVFDPIGSEINAGLLIEHIVSRGGTVCLPKTHKDGPLGFVAWSKDAQFADAGFGTRAPVGPETVTPDILVVPLLAFDRAGHRVGYGQGHYDRTITSFSHQPKLIGLAYHVQEATHIDTKPHDVPLDLIITDQDVIVIAK